MGSISKKRPADFIRIVSIHAPCMVSTKALFTQFDCDIVSIHAPRMGNIA